MDGIGILLVIINFVILFICVICAVITNMTHDLRDMTDFVYSSKMKTYAISGIFSVMSLHCLFLITTDPFSTMLLGMSMLFTFMSMYVHYIYFDLH